MPTPPTPPDQPVPAPEAGSEPAPPSTDSTPSGDTPPAPAPDEAPAAPTEIAAAPAEPEDDSSKDPGDQGEIVVTADRRETTLQRYAGSAAVFSQQDLDRQGIRSVRDVAAAAPNVEIGTQEGNTEVFMRGVGSNYNTELGDPAVATHIDGIYIPRPRGVGSMLFDVERLEMSLGPQGTLRGRNATGGTLNIITARPVLGEWLGEGSVQLGNYSQRLGRGMINIPVGEHVALRLATMFETHAPYYENAGPIKTLNAAESADTLAYRASLLVAPVDKLKINVRHDYTREGGTGYQGANFAPALGAGFLPEEVPNPRAVIYRGPQGYQDLIHWGINGDVTVDLGPVLIAYTGSYRNLAFKSTSAGNSGVNFPGYDYGNLDDWGTSYWHTTSKSVVQELRVFAPNTARVRWSAGGFFFNEDQTAFLGQTSDRSNAFFGTEYNMPSVTGRSWAGFADATVDVLKWLRATGGIRVTTEKKGRDGIGNVYGFSGLTDPVRFGTEGFQWAGRGRGDFQQPSAPTAPFDDFRNGIARFGQRDTLSDALMQPGVTQWDNLNEQHGTYDNSFVDFRLGSDLDITKDNLLYGLFSTGHKSGGFNDNVRTMSGETIAPTYNPEVLYSTEIGSKNKFLDGKLITNLAAFWYHYANAQYQSIQNLTDVFGMAAASTSLRFNVANARILGLEASAAARLPYGFSGNLAAMFLDARFVDGQVADTRVGFDAATQPIVSLEDKFLPRAPQLSLNYAIRQTIRTDIGRFDWSVSAQTKSQQFMTVFNGKGRDPNGTVEPNLSDVVPTYTRVDAAVGYTVPDGRLRLDAFVTNLTDVVYMTTLINTPNLNLRFFNPPRQVGVRLTVQL
ncbi:MAG: TonB-dependent receptor plug domain-containing protein [Polyangiales bacterium]